ncbi:Synaptic vesicle transporter SVOP and related transporters (major facilitator superfamily) [Ceraceosorus bombacis]|uniref:Synaptic vesicle transporter SVOP and related transporters (Major facilitator superfamily) n=1 Tax=Ceraceosorus bombacis TaxID=401625 RepID=A0A0P1BDG7_9BASI|nr:Synaptic vesicle transporter SVOP and related transporters (major facilitator superfamily) [Ceraceosorus bombacis]
MALAASVAVGLLIFGKETRLLDPGRADTSPSSPPNERLGCPERNGSDPADSRSCGRNLARPLVYLFTEPIVAIFSVWIGFTFGVCYLVIESAYVIFKAQPTPVHGSEATMEYGWTDLQTSGALLAYVAGALLGFLTSLLQEKVYQGVVRRCEGRPTPPEARLGWSLVGGVTFAAACFWYAFAARPNVHPAAAIVALAFIVAGVFPIHCASFAYLADIYEEFAASALAGQTFVRTVAAGCFPLFADYMYRALTPPTASAVLGAVAALQCAIPLILMRYGPALRARSRRA